MVQLKVLVEVLSEAESRPELAASGPPVALP